MNLFTKQKETHRLRKQTYGCHGEGVVRDFGKVMYTLLYLKWITSKDLLQSTWNSVQGYVAARMEGDFGREFCCCTVARSCPTLWPPWNCICMAESLHCSPETITTLLLGYTPIQKKKFYVWGKNDWYEKIIFIEIRLFLLLAEWKGSPKGRRYMWLIYFAV